MMNRIAFRIHAIANIPFIPFKQNRAYQDHAMKMRNTPQTNQIKKTTDIGTVIMQM